MLENTYSVIFPAISFVHFVEHIQETRMSEYHVSRNGKQFGPYGEDALKQYIADGTVALTDLYWREGMPEWRPVSELVPSRSNTPLPPQAPPQPPAQNIPESWRTKFALMEKAGGVKMPRIKELSFSERMKLLSNVWAFLFGPIYYLIKGLWKKAIVYFAISIVLFVVLDRVFAAMGMRDSAFLNFIGPAIFAARANIDYYKKVVLGEDDWL